MSQKPSELSFEKAMSGLEEIVGKLERGELPLEKSLEAFEKGSKLAAQCQQKLSEAEMRLEKVVTKK